MNLIQFVVSRADCIARTNNSHLGRGANASGILELLHTYYLPHAGRHMLVCTEWRWKVDGQVFQISAATSGGHIEMILVHLKFASSLRYLHTLSSCMELSVTALDTMPTLRALHRC